MQQPWYFWALFILFKLSLHAYFNVDYKVLDRESIFSTTCPQFTRRYWPGRLFREGGMGALLHIASVSYHLHTPPALFVYLKQPTFVWTGNMKVIPTQLSESLAICLSELCRISRVLPALVPLQLVDTISSVVNRRQCISIGFNWCSNTNQKNVHRCWNSVGWHLEYNSVNIQSVAKVQSQ